MPNSFKTTSTINDFIGLELCTFKLKKGGSEGKMLDAAIAMEREFLSKEQGFLGHGVLTDGDGLYLDLTFAQSQKQAEAICEA